MNRSHSPRASMRAQFLYSGQPGAGAPKELLLDRRLTPQERNAWLVIRLLQGEQPVVTAGYEDLQPHLGSLPCGGAASKETIARTLTLLRLSRWLSQVPRARGRLYVLHDSPLTAAEAQALDPGYGALLERSLNHAAQAVRRLALSEWEALQPEQAGVSNPSPVNQQHESERRPLAVSAVPPARSASERPIKTIEETAACISVRNPDSVRTVLNTHTKTCINTVPRLGANGDARTLHWPTALHLKPVEQRSALRALETLEPSERQAVLDEAQARYAAGGIRQPVAYLMGLIRRAQRGDFRPWAARQIKSPAPEARATPWPSAEPTPRQPGQPLSALVQSCLAELRNLGQPRHSA